jgi:hypothetical protein
MADEEEEKTLIEEELELEKKERKRPVAPKERRVNPWVVIGALIIIVILLVVVLYTGTEDSDKKEVAIIYSGQWQGTLVYGNATKNTTKSVSGTGSKTYEVEGDFVSAVIQKLDDGTLTLTVRIQEGGSTVATDSTNAAFGVVSIHHTF